MKLFVFLFLFNFVCVGQTLDSAKKLNDSAVSIYKNQPKKALEIFEQSEAVAKSKNETLEYARAKNGLGLIYRDLGEFEKAIAYANAAMSISKDSLLTASALNNIGRSKRQLGLYEDALTYYLQALDIYDDLNKKEEEATVTNNIGLVYSYLGINDKAIEYHLKAKTAFEALNNKKGISEVYNNIAIIYANDGDLEKALDYFKYSLAIEVDLDDKKGMAESANNVGAVYYYMQEVDSALTYFEQSVSIEKSIGNFAGLPASFNNIAQVLMENKRLSESKTFIDSAYQYAQDYKVATEIENSLLNYSEYYEASQNNSKALDYYKAYSKAKDSLLNIGTNSKIAELEIEYQTEKKEKELLEHRADLAEKELDLSKKNNYILGLSALAIVLMLLGYLIYNQQKLKNRQLKKENELKDALIKIETQSKLQEQRLRISRDLHDNIGAQLTFIISSLDNLKYGFKLPEKLSQKLVHISEFTTTTIYELRDTIWAMNKNEITFEDLQIRISNFIDTANLAAHNISFHLHIDDNVDKEAVFSSVEGMNIYRIIQEAINNALKYAEAKNINLSIKEIDDKLEIVISDNGKGFDETTVELGNGIQNMKKRATEINGILIIESNEGKGTIITLKL
ncbi:ATP-binding protein [Winogradskyella thalassocola]|uniref:Tetratricopeptide repeat-containing protein n=1 Tax=Winogradskyella thalassocola TaxID=262004 RepID=A0A1G8GUQ8_9FLAO|nr:sensor histidine kinase [Winogradskyella thalassocola]SDH98138.1 Tetratricopeptide repeat-containing protein [Winogradskyella thalassocola]